MSDKVISHQQSLRAQLIGECLSTHRQLKPEDIIWALDYNFTVISAEQFAIVVVHLCKSTDIGRFSMCYNHTVDISIISRNKRNWAGLLSIDHKDAFPEYYDQTRNFNEHERNIVLDRHTTEYNVAYQLISSMEEVDFPLRQYLIHRCPSSKCKDGCPSEWEIVSSSFSNGGVTSDAIHSDTMYKQCYDKVCIMKKESTVTHPVDDVIMIPDINYMEINDTRYRMAFGYCLSIITLLQQLVLHNVSVLDKSVGRSYETAINPVTGEPFDIAVYEMLKKRLSVEIKLYQYYVNRISAVK